MNCPICRIQSSENDKRTLFLSAELECKICLIKKESSDFECLKCGHAFCKNCVSSLFSNSTNNYLDPELWLRDHYPTLQYVTYEYMQNRNWPDNIIQYVQMHWYTYPSSYVFPIYSNIYYRFINNIRIV